MNTLDGAGAVRLATARSDAGRVKVDGDDRIANKTLRAVLASHLPDDTGTSCVACGFAYTPKSPLCPSVAGALRELSTIDARSRTPKSPLARFSTERLRSMAREHGGDGRCRRCGFVYSGEVRSCPTYRRISAELEARAKAPVTQTRAGQGLCVGKGAGWVVDGHDPKPWKRAMAACSMCPLLAQCEAKLAAGGPLHEQIMAGRLFTVRGKEIGPEKIDAYAVSRGRRKKKEKPAAASAAPKLTLASAPAASQAAPQLTLFDSVAA